MTMEGAAADDSGRKSSISVDNRSSPTTLLSSSRFRSSSSTCIDRDSREKYHPEGKKKAGLGKFFRHLGSAKTSPRHGPKPGLPKSNSQAERSQIDDASPGHGNEAEEEEQMKIVKMVQESYISTRAQPSQSVIAELGRAMSWSSQGTKKKDKNYMSLFFTEGTAKNSKSFDPAKESKSWCEQTTTSKESPGTTASSPVLTNHCTSTTAATTTTTSTEKSSAPGVCGGDCGNIMCSLSPVCIEDIFDDPKKPSSPTGPPSDDVSDDGSLRRRTKSEGCYSAAYRCKSNKKSSPSLDSSRELLSPPAQDDSDEVDTGPNEGNRTSSSTTTWSGRVRDLKREVKHRICRLRSPKSSNSTQVPESNTTVLEAPDSTENISKECDTLTNQQSVLSNSNQGFSSTGEEESFGEGGRTLGKARALVDCTPSPYDKDGLAFKKGDIIDILAKSSSGYWVGKLGNQIGHFKFINVEEIPNGDRKTSKRRFSSFDNKSNLGKTLEDLLQHLGLEIYMNVLVLNGYHNLDSLKGIEEQDLISLGIVNSDHRIKLLNAIEYFEDLNFGVTPSSMEGTQSPLHQQKSNHVSFSSRFSSPRKRSESCSSNVPESYLPYSPKVSNTDAYPDTAYTCNEINNLDYGMPSVNRNNGSEQIEDDRSRDILNIPLNRPSDKLYFYSDLHSNQKIHYSYGRGISAYTEQLYFSRAGLVIDSPNKSHLLSQMNYLEKLSDFSVGGPTFNHLNGSIYPNSGSYITKEEKYLMESSRLKLKEQMRSFGQESNHVNQRRNESDFNGYLDEGPFQNSLPLESSENNGKSLTLPRQMKGCPPSDLLILQPADVGVYKSDRKGKKSRRRKESPQPLLQCSTQPFTLDDFVAKKLQDEQIDLCLEPYTDKTGFCGIPPALVQRYADELQQDIFDVAEALDRERVRALQRRGRPAVPNDFLADSCCEPVVEANYNSLSDWLISLGLPIYEKLFHCNGCTELYHIAGLNDKDLIRYGIENPKHIRLLTTAIEALHIHIEHCQYIA
ncbi:uncharacterized protein LOC129969127 isoform X2 [Argiope bruennichi]|uniref:uncharacterized protein LOC129969127 isoform X2 n=1 Tax=Argiope bruennichi TaxID=94029 RepID=UPI0024951317|nr:uncharacterized protein LOC129969127 isoform X2 [Argiope bruennichi]